MKQQLEDIQGRALAALDAATSPAALEELRVKLLGKKGELTAVLKQMGKLSPEERKRLDIYYAQHLSPLLDLKIILKTFTAFIQKENV